MELINKKDGMFDKPQELQNYLDSLNLQKCKIVSLRARGNAYNLSWLGDEYDACMEAIENNNEEYFALPKECEDIYGPRLFEGDEPLLILLDNGKILSLLADFMDIYHAKIEEMSYDKFHEILDYIDTDVFFAPVIGYRIDNIAVKAMEHDRNIIASIDIIMENNLTLRIRTEIDFIDIEIINDKGKTLMISGNELEQAVPPKSRYEQFMWDIEDLREQYSYLINKNKE